MKLILIRHGFDFAGRLLPEGLAQCEAVKPYAAGIVGENPLIITSPSPRAIETASTLFDHPKIEDDSFGERDDSSKAGRALIKYLKTAYQDDHSSLIIITHRPIIEGLLGSWVSADNANIFEIDLDKKDNGYNFARIQQTIPNGGLYVTKQIFPKIKAPGPENTPGQTPENPPAPG